MWLKPSVQVLVKWGGGINYFQQLGRETSLFPANNMLLQRMDSSTGHWLTINRANPVSNPGETRESYGNQSKINSFGHGATEASCAQQMWEPARRSNTEFTLPVLTLSPFHDITQIHYASWCRTFFSAKCFVHVLLYWRPSPVSLEMCDRHRS